MDNRNSFLKYLLTFSVFLALEAAAVLLIVNNGDIQRLKLMEAAGAVSAWTGKTINGISGYFSLKQANRRLAEENGRLYGEVSMLREQISLWKADTASYARNSADSLPAPVEYTAAEVVSNSTDRLHNYLIINKGTEDGIEQDMGVVTGRGVIGYVINAGKHYSKVVSLLDTDNMVSAVLRRNGTFGTLRWDGKRPDRAILHDIPLHTAVNEGDTVETSGYSLIYPAGIMIGTIVSRDNVDGINYDLTVQLFEDFSKIRHVYAVTLRDKDDIRELTEPGTETEKTGGK